MPAGRACQKGEITVAFSVQSVIDRDSEIWQTLWAWPKIDLHRHLEGSIRLPTLIEVAREYDIPLPTYDEAELRPHVQMTEQDPGTSVAFLNKFEVLRRFYCSLEVIQRLAREAVEDAAGDNVKYLELRFTPHALARYKNYDYRDVISSVSQGVRQAEAAHDIRVKLIISVNRHESVDIAHDVLDAALRSGGTDIVAIDLAGQEVGYSARRFDAFFERANSEGLRETVHAGEWDGPENVREAVAVLDADRIGHGVRALEDPAVVQLVRERGVTLEVCPTSNLQTGAVGRVEDHPLPRLIAHDLLTTINTDDPSICDITLTDELAMAHVALGLSLEQLRRTILNAAQAAFIPHDERAALVAQFRHRLGMDQTQT
jgi:adenosine deaminase